MGSDEEALAYRSPSSMMTLGAWQEFAPAIPEPSTYLLFGIGILGIIGMGYRQRRKVA